MRTVSKPCGYTLPLFSAAAWNPADAQTVFVGSNIVGIAGTWNDARVEVPKAGVIRRIWYNVRVNGTLGSGETVQHFLRLNDATDFALANGTYAAAQQNLVNANFGQVVAAGDYIASKIVTPTFVNNPTNVFIYALAYIE
jgi:hypothetical protein